ncbi:MAG: hypothetical protein COX46_05955, partial [bacterium (Candidatus Ratteibacteria) CG23_combo_of_CG06-09_8_20_14_all_48_7]
WLTGKDKKMNWEKEWVWVKGPESPRNFYVYFRGWFESGEGVKKVLVHLTADSRYLLYLNGEFQGRGPAKCDPKYQYYDTYNVTKKVTAGRNLIAVLVHHYGEETFSYLLGRGGFLCQSEVIYNDGHKKVYGTDSSWRTKSAEAWDQNASRTTVQLGFQEIYDAKKEPVGWQKPDFDDTSWDTPVLLGKPLKKTVGVGFIRPETGSINRTPTIPWENLIPRDIPFLKESALLPQRVVEIGEIAGSNVGQGFSLALDNLNLAGLLENELHLPWNKEGIKGLKNLLRQNDRYLEISVPENGLYLILDFGKEVTGFPNFTLETEEDGGMVDLAYDE